MGRKVKVKGNEAGKGNEIFKFNLGDMVKDRITGFKGIVTRRTQWFNSCCTYGVQPQALKPDGTPIESQAFDEPQLELVEPEAKKEEVKGKAKTGGPQKPMEAPRSI